MKPARRAAALTALLALAALSLLLTGTLTGTAAGAAPYSGAASVSVERSNPCHGSPLRVTGDGYPAGATVVVTIGGTQVGRATAGADGTISLTVTVPDALRGTQTLTATGGSQVATTDLTVEACGGSGVAGVSTGPASPGAGGSGAEGVAAGGSGSGGGGLSTTGVAVLGLLVVAAGLVVGGAVLLLAGRRRSASHA